MTTNFKSLFDFIDRAVKSRKYPEATAHTLRAALKLYEGGLNEEESNSVQVFKDRFEQITASVFNKNANSFSASSLTTYKSRAQKVLNDFEKYGDPQKMNSWSPKVVLRSKKKETTQKNVDTADETPPPSFVRKESYSYSDAGTGWTVTIQSAKPISTEIKKKVIEVSELLDTANATD